LVARRLRIVCCTTGFLYWMSFSTFSSVSVRVLAEPVVGDKITVERVQRARGKEARIFRWNILGLA
jgi:hypothetical protein